MTVKSSRAAFQALRLLAAEKRPLEASYIGNALSVPTTTTLRVMATLEAAGFAERDRATGRFRLGTAATTLSFAFMSQFPVRDLALPYLQQMTLETGQTSSLFVRMGSHTLRIAAVLGQRTLIHRTPVGEIRSLLVGAHGQAIAATPIGGATDSDSLRSATAVSQGVDAIHFFLAACPFEPTAWDVAWPLFNSISRPIASVGFEGVPEQLSESLVAPTSAVHAIAEELARAADRELGPETSHYEHVDPNEIVFEQT